MLHCNKNQVLFSGDTVYRLQRTADVNIRFRHAHEQQWWKNNHGERMTNAADSFQISEGKPDWFSIV